MSSVRARVSLACEKKPFRQKNEREDRIIIRRGSNVRKNGVRAVEGSVIRQEGRKSLPQKKNQWAVTS